MEKYFDINESGYSVRCKLYGEDTHNISRVVLFGHGFGGHKDNKAAERFAKYVLDKYKNIAVLTFDWPCHGDDGRKKLRLDDCNGYLDVILKYINEHFDPETLFAYATSFGGYLVLKYIAERGNPFYKVVLRCPAVNMYQVLTTNIMSEEELEKICKGKDALVGFDRKIKISRDFLTELKEADIMAYDYSAYADDILIIHGTSDEIVPPQASKDFADSNFIDWVPVERADHRFKDPKKMDEAIGYITRFLAL